MRPIAQRTDSPIVQVLTQNLITHDAIEKRLIQIRRTQSPLARWWQDIRQDLLIALTWMLLPSWAPHNRMEVIILDRMAFEATNAEIVEAIDRYDEADEPLV